jgi:O-antigen/teichoic acid export membrane protein
MSLHRRATKWNLVFIYIKIGLTIVSGFLLPPLYIEYISPDMYGAWLATGNVLAWITVLDPGLATALEQRIGKAHGSEDVTAIGEWIGAGIIVSICLSLLVTLVGVLAGDQLIEWLDLPPAIGTEVLKRAFFWAVIGTGLSLFSYTFAVINQGLQSTLATGLCSASVNALSIGLIVILVWQGYGLFAIAWGMLFRGAGWLLGNALFLLLWRLRHDGIRIAFSLSRLRELLRLTSFTFLGRIGGTLANHVDAFVIARLLGPQTVTVFEMTRRAPNGARPFVERISNAVMPSVSSVDGQGRTETLQRVLVRLLTVMSWVLGLLVVGFICFNDDFVRLWLGPDFFAGTRINALIMVGLLLGILVRSLSNLCLALGNIEGNSVVSFIESLFFAVLLYFGVTHFGLLGAVVAPIIAKLSVSAWYYPWMFTKLIDMSFRDLKALSLEFIKALTLAGGVGAIFWTLSPVGWIGLVCHAIAMTVTYAVGLYLVSKRFRDEGHQLVATVHRRLS